MTRPDATATVTGRAPRFAWTRLITATLARTVLLAVVSLGLWGAVPTLIGWHATTVMTGSMQPRLLIGDVAVSKPTAVSALAVGQIVLFADPDHPGRLRLHRFVGVDEQGRLITRGDANDADDSSHVDPSTVVGVAVLRVPSVATPIVWLRDGRYGLVAGAAAAVLALMLLATADRDLRRRLDADDTDDSDDQGDRGDRPRRRPLYGPGDLIAGIPAVTRRFPVGFAIIGLAAALAGTVGGTPAYAAFADVETNARSTMNAGYYNCSRAALGDAPYLLWRLDETSVATGTTAADSSGNGRTGSYQNASSPVATGCGTGRSMTFNGTTSYLTTASTTAVAAPNTFSIEVWFKTNTTSGGKLVGFGNARTGASSVYDRHLYMTNTGAVVFGVYPGAVKTLSSATGLNNNAWHHVVGTLSSAGMKLYVDGVLVGSDSSVTSGESSTGFWRVGYDSLASWTNVPKSNFFAGTLDNVAVYTTALDGDTVAAHYASNS